MRDKLGKKWSTQRRESGQDSARYSWNNQIMATSVCTQLVGTCKSHQDPAQSRMSWCNFQGEKLHIFPLTHQTPTKGIKILSSSFLKLEILWQKIQLEALQSNDIFCCIVQYFNIVRWNKTLMFLYS